MSSDKNPSKRNYTLAEFIRPWPVYLLLFAAYLAMLFANKYLSLEDNNVFENAVEDVIEFHTGLDIEIPNH